MADKAIGSLVQTSTIGLNDLLVLEQNNTAKSITGQNLVSQLATELDGHGGIASIAKTGSAGTNPVVDTYTVTYADATTTTFTVTNGKKGSTGAQTYVWIRYANRQPVADSDLTTTPDAWIGIYTGTSSTAPTAYGSYDWYQYKGDTGNTGAAAQLTSTAIEYQAGASGTSAPTGAWSSTIPTVPQGEYLWTRTTLTFNSGNPVVFYAVARAGVDGTGTGTVQSVNSITPDGNGDVELSASDIGTTTVNVSVQDELNAKAEVSSASVTIATTDWSNGSCTKNVTGVTTANHIIVSPAPSSYLAYGEAQIRATAQGNGTVTFACESTPAASVTVNIMIVG